MRGGGTKNLRRFLASFFEETCVRPLPPVCRPSGWIAIWRRLGNLSILNRRAVLSP